MTKDQETQLSVDANKKFTSVSSYTICFEVLNIFPNTKYSITCLIAKCFNNINPSEN